MRLARLLLVMLWVFGAPIHGQELFPITSLVGTANQVLVNASATIRCVGRCTLSTPQDIHTGASPTFVGATLSGLTATRLMLVGTGGLVSDDANLTWASNILTMQSTAASSPQVLLQHVGDTAGSRPYAVIQRARAGPAAVQSADSVGDFLWKAYANGDYRNVSTLQTIVNAAPVGSVVPSRVVFGVTNAAAFDTQFVFAPAGLSIGNVTFPSTGTYTLIFRDGTAPSSMGTNTAGLYVNDVTGTVELFGIDEAGNTPQLTPHDFSAFTPDPQDAYPWTYSSSNRYLGVHRRVDMSGAIRAVERLTGQRFIFDEQLPVADRQDWRTVQDTNYARAAAESEAWEQRRQQWTPTLEEPSFTELRPPDPVRKDPPYWLAQRLAARGLWAGTLPDATARPPVAMLTVTPGVGPDLLTRLAAAELALAAAIQRIAILEASR